MDPLLEEVLEHQGVLGMRWGHLRAQSFLDRGDKKFENKVAAKRTLRKVHKEARRMTNIVDVQRIKDKPEYFDLHRLGGSDHLVHQYNDEVKAAYFKNVQKAYSNRVGESRSGKTITITASPKGDRWRVDIVDSKHDPLPASPIQHADNIISLNVKLHLDSIGCITSIGEDEEDALAQGGDMDALQEVLEHHGIRGMHWGQRKSSGSGGSGSKPTKGAVSKASKSAISEKMLKHHKAVASEMGPSISKINAKSKYKNVDLNKNRPLKKEYHNELANAFTAKSAKKAGVSVPQFKTMEKQRKIAKGLKIAAVSVLALRIGAHLLAGNYGRAISSTITVAPAALPKMWDSSFPGKYSSDPGEDGRIRGEIIKRSMGQSDSDENKLFHADVDVAYFDLDATGHATSCHAVEPDTEFEHSDSVDEVLEHHGIRGMHWGRRRSSEELSSPSGLKPSRSAPTAVTARGKPGKYVKTAGGQRHPPSEDALTSLVTRQIAKSSTTDALSNKQLQAAVSRMNLETQYHNLSSKSPRIGAGRRFIMSLVKNKATVDTAVKFAKSDKGIEIAANLGHKPSIIKNAANIAKKAAKGGP